MLCIRRAFLKLDIHQVARPVEPLDSSMQQGDAKLVAQFPLHPLGHARRKVLLLPVAREGA
jgi:hypothetical protein